MFRALTIAAFALFFTSAVLADEKNPKDAPEKNSKVETKEGAVDKVAAKKEAIEQLKKKEAAEGKKPVKEGAKEGNPKEAPKDKGRVEKVGVDGQTIVLLIDGKKYTFNVNEDTRANLKTREEDGKEVVLALQLVNMSDAPKKPIDKKEAAEKKVGGEKKEGVKKVPEKSDGEVKKEGKPEETKQPAKKQPAKEGEKE